MVWPVSWITLCTIFTTCSAFDLLPHLRIVSVASDSSSAVTAGFRNFMMPTVSPFDLFSFLKNTPNLALITVPKIKVCASFAWYMRLMTLTGGTPEAGLTATPSFKDRLIPPASSSSMLMFRFDANAVHPPSYDRTNPQEHTISPPHESFLALATANAQM